MQEIKRNYGPESMALFTHGSATEHFLHMMSAYGSPNFAMPSFSQCRGPRVVAYELTFGEDVGSPERLDMTNSRVVVLLGSHLGENMHNSQVQDFAEALGRGTTLIVVDPRFSLAAGKANHWLPIRPGTDLALLLAWINIIIAEGWYDKDYIETYATGFEELAAAVKGYTPAWAEKETDIPAEVIVRTAREMGKNRPAVCIHPGRHVTWDGHDVQRERAIAILSALLGTWGRKGGLFLPTEAKLPAIPGPDYPVPRRETLKKGNYPFAGDEGITVAVREATITGKPYPIKGWIMSGTNLLAALPDQARTREAIEKLDLFVAVDVMPMDTVMMADVILPECTYLERHDAIAVGKGRSLTLSLRQPVVEPMYESKPAWWIAKELGAKLGLSSFFPWHTYQEKLKKQCLQWNASYAELKKKGVITIPNSAHPYIDGTREPEFKTPSGMIELASESLKAHGFDAVPQYHRNPQIPKDSFLLLYGRSSVHTFSRTTNNPALSELFPENEVWVNAARARALGIATGDYVILVNQDGIRSNRVRVKATERIRHDCVYMVHGFGSRNKGLSRVWGKGADDQSLVSRYRIDPIAGTTGMRVNTITIEKEGTNA
jgi:thiosulfate reductase/polysulfide reductase chain A